MRGAPAHDWPVLTSSLAQLLLAQAMVERGVLDQFATGLSSAKYQLELYVGQGNTIYVVIGVVLLLVLTRVRRNR
jgi:hypothetical protein